MKKEHGFLNTLRISAFDFKSYTTFLSMPTSKVILNRILFVLIISIFYVFSFNKSVKQLNEFNMKKEEIFKDISYSNGLLNVENSPVIFTPTIFSGNDFIFIGDTRDDFNLDNYTQYDDYRNALVLTKDSFIFKSRLNEMTIKYSDFMLLNTLPKDQVINKDMFFSIIQSVSDFMKYAIYIVFPISMVFDYFLFALITSFFAMLFSIISRFRTSFSQVFKMILFAQTVPYLIISIFEIISQINGVNFIFPLHILEFLTLIVFLVSVYSIKKDTLGKGNGNNK